MKISERRLKKFDEEVTRAFNELMKPVRGLHEIKMEYNFYVHAKDSSLIYDKIDDSYIVSGSGSFWKTISIGKRSNRRISIFSPR